MPISWNTVIFTFRLIFGTDERRIVSRNGLSYGVLGKPIDPFQQKKQCQAENGCMKSLSRYKSTPHRSKKIKQNLKMTVQCISRNGHRINQDYSTNFNDLGIILFSSAFWGDTRYWSILHDVHKTSSSILTFVQSSGIPNPSHANTICIIRLWVWPSIEDN